MPTPLALRALFLVASLPVAAFAEDAPTTTVIVQPGASPVTVHVGPPGAATPVPATPIIAPIADDDPCDGRLHGAWRQKLRGRFALGMSAGKVALDDETDGRQKSLIARATGRRGFGIEVELARTTLGDDSAKSIGGALFKSFGQRRVAPYVIAGGGRGMLDRADGSESDMKFGEIGGGLMVRGRRISIGVDVRRGVRKVDAAELAPDAMPVDDTQLARPVTADDDHGERYTRARIVALVTF